jgi:bifunctional non-homologous end joining protein LigD
MGLRTYRQKRDFTRTAEPRGDERVAKRRGGDGYLIQKHAASHLHFDFRLELDGVLLSWAVPKGAPVQPGTRALAMRTEDHPIEYGTFEGVIPKGEYGGGTVMLWDRGTWKPDGDPRRGLRDGKLDFTLAGERLRGRWSLVRMAKKPNETRESWLLIKRSDDDAGARTAVPGAADTSVVTGRTMEQIAHAADRQWSSRHGEVKPTARRGAAARDGGTNGTARARTPAPTKAKLAPAAKATPRSGARATDAAAVAATAGELPGARATVQPKRFTPQLATLVDTPPDGEQWLHEMKFDGYRLLAFVDGPNVRLLTRTGQDWTDRFPSVRAAVAALGVPRAVLDGEVVVLRPDGTSDFQLLQNLVDRGEGRGVVFFAFDLPHCGGFDLTRAPLLARKELLARLLGPTDERAVLRYSEHVVGHGAAFFRQACALGLEGVVSKLADSGYQTKRTRSWIKLKCLQRQELVVGGFTRPEGSREHFGALLVGVHDERGELRYAGKVGTGFTAASLAELMRRLRPLTIDTPPFADPPRGAEARRATWVRPECVVEVAFTEWTGDGKLRHPSFQGMRDDKDPRTIRRERAVPTAAAAADAGPAAGNAPVAATRRPARTAATAAAARAPRARSKRPTQGTKPGAKTKARAPASGDVVAGVRITNPQRVLYPKVGVSKLDVARYYEAVAEHVLPHVVGRPLTIVRCPQGLQAMCFYQKHIAQTLPPPVTSYRVEEKDGADDYVGIEDLTGLVTLVQFGVLELHPWGSRAANLEKPDRIVLDLDPGPDVPWANMIAAAHGLRALLDELELASFPRTTGGKGLHVVVPIVPGPGWDEVKAFAEDLCAALARRDPPKYVLVATKARRHGRIFLDWLRNGRGATAVASWSTRARDEATVAMPLAWDDVTAKLDPLAFTTRTVPSLLASRGDAWGGFATTKQHLTAAKRAAAREL